MKKTILSLAIAAALLIPTLGRAQDALHPPPKEESLYYDLRVDLDTLRDKPNTVLVDVAEFVQSISAALYKAGAFRVEVKWINVLDAEVNPDAKFGRIRVIGYRRVKGGGV